MNFNEIFSNKLIEIAKTIVADSNDRITNPNRENLKKGVFYGNEYYIASSTHLPKWCELFKTQGNFYHGIASPGHFVREKNDISATGYSTKVVIKQNVKPSSALQTFLPGESQKLSFIGCGETCQITYYLALLHILGEKKFDILYGQDSPTPLSIQFDDPSNPLNPFFDIIIDKTVKPLKGDIVRFKSIDNYYLKHVNGESAGFISMCCEDQGQAKYTTLGLNPSGMTQDEITDVLLKEYNREPFGFVALTEQVAQTIFSNYLEDMPVIQALKNDQITKQEFLEYGGGEKHIHLRPNAFRITQLQKSTPEKALKLMQKWKKQTKGIN